MLTRTYRTLVHAQPGTVWNLLLDSVENPQLYHHGIEGTKIVERSEEGVVREFDWEGRKVRDRVEIRPGEHAMAVELLDHPVYTGLLITRALPTSVQNPMAPLYLETEVRLERKSLHLDELVKTEAELGQDIERDLEVIKQKAEELEQREQ